MIAIWDENHHWQELLRQEGVTFTTGSRLTGRDVVILNCEPSGLHTHRIWQHIESGGGLLAAVVNAAEVWLELKPTAARLRWIAPDGDSSLFRNVGIVDAETLGSLLPGANAGVTDSGAAAILANPAGRGFRILLPFDVTGVLSDMVSAPKQFPADTPRLPYDTVARTSRGEVRRLVANCLRFLLARKGLPYVHLASVPGGLSPHGDCPQSSAFAFRVDTDFGPRRDIEVVARLADRVGMKFSWYVNVGAHKAHLDLFADLAREGHDIQLHCMRHTVFPDYKRNLENFRQGRDAMAAAGMSPVGVVAPFGEWNQNLNRAFEELGFEYSSEFCLAYDDLPFRPVVGERLSKVLQLPVHPICLGRLAAARATPRQMAAYLRSVIDLQVARREPCFLYDHPERIAQFSDVLADVLQHGKECCGATTTMTDYARWWQRRERFAWTSRVSDAGLEIRAKKNAEDLTVIVEQDGRYARLPAATGAYPLTSLTWHAGPEPVRFEPRSLATRKPSLLLRARSLNRKARKTLRGHRG
jgi:peptidoglycan/xylan/chitin deacetylase (PgdA/CDA1 family)